MVTHYESVSRTAVRPSQKCVAVTYRICTLRFKADLAACVPIASCFNLARLRAKVRVRELPGRLRLLARPFLERLAPPLLRAGRSILSLSLLSCYLWASDALTFLEPDPMPLCSPYLACSAVALPT